MNEQLKELLWSIAKSHLTKALTAGAGALVTYGVINQDQVAPIVTGVMAFIVSSAISIWQRYRDQIKLAIAARLPAGTTIEQVKNEARRNALPLKHLVAVLLAIALFGVGCAPRVTHPTLQPISCRAITLDAAEPGQGLHPIQPLCSDGQLRYGLGPGRWEGDLGDFVFVVVYPAQGPHTRVGPEPWPMPEPMLFIYEAEPGKAVTVSLTERSRRR